MEIIFIGKEIIYTDPHVFKERIYIYLKFVPEKYREN